MLIDDKTSPISKEVGTTGKEKKYLEKLIDTYLPNRHKRDKDRTKRIEEAILEARNQISKKNLEQVLRDQDTPENILLVIGGAHYKITETD